MNVLFIVFDDLTTTLGCYGHPLAQTPHIDRLAARGVTFTRSFTPCPLCNPSRATLFSGYRPDTVGVRTLREKLRSKLPHMVTLPQALRQRGWSTARAGKVFHMGVPDTIAMRESGNDDPYAWDEAVNCPGKELNTSGYFYNATPWDSHHAGTGGGISWLKGEKADNQQHDYNVASEISARIRTYEEPFFLAAGFIRPHVPFVAPKRYFNRYDPADVELPRTPPDATPLLPAVLDRFGAGFNLSEDDHRAAIAAYLACVSFADDQVGRLLDALDESGRANDTIVVLTVDHGYHLGEHTLWFKNFLYRESTQVPLIIVDPRRSSWRGRRCDALVENVDVYPTLMELLDLANPWGSPMPHEPEGVSLVNVIDGNVDRVRNAVFAQCHGGITIPHEGRAIRTYAWCYNEWDEGAAGRELYDLRSDPGEHVNLLHDGAQHPMVVELAARLRAGWRGELVSS